MVLWSEIKHFKQDEFRCKCCGKYFVKDDLIYMLDRARDLAGVSFKLNSAYRCQSYNKKVGGVKDSAHTKGLAVEIAAPDDCTRFSIVSALLEVGFKRVLLYDTFIHCDIDLDKPNPILKIMK